MCCDCLYLLTESFLYSFLVQIKLKRRERHEYMFETSLMKTNNPLLVNQFYLSPFVHQISCMFILLMKLGLLNIINW